MSISIIAIVLTLTLIVGELNHRYRRSPLTKASKERGNDESQIELQ